MMLNINYCTENLQPWKAPLKYFYVQRFRLGLAEIVLSPQPSAIRRAILAHGAGVQHEHRV